MSTIPDLTAKIEKRVEATWAATVSAEQLSAGREVGEVLPAWPHRFPVGRVSGASLAADLRAHIDQLWEWREWAKRNNVDLLEGTRLVGGTRQTVITHAVVDSLDTGAAVAAGTLPITVETGRRYAMVLLDRFPQLVEREQLEPAAFARLLRAVTRLSEIDFDILCRVSTALLEQKLSAGAGSGSRLTPRQVPVEGVHAKWLQSHQALVQALTGLDDLELAPPHPPRFHFTYLDPEHLKAGRKHDSYSVGDNVVLPYEPQVVVISENKDTAIGFPEVPKGIAIEGEGRGSTTIASAVWVRDAPIVIYWGDLDQDGLEILNEFRAAGIPVVSILTDVATYERYRRYGTNADKNGRRISMHTPRPVPYLTTAELELYELLSSGRAPQLRIEQERIPLPVALAEVERVVSSST